MANLEFEAWLTASKADVEGDWHEFVDSVGDVELFEETGLTRQKLFIYPPLYTMENKRIIAPFYNNHKHNIILDRAIQKAVKMLTGRKAFTQDDRTALGLLGIELVHVEDMAKTFQETVNSH